MSVPATGAVRTIWPAWPPCSTSRWPACRAPTCCGASLKARRATLWRQSSTRSLTTWPNSMAPRAARPSPKANGWPAGSPSVSSRTPTPPTGTSPRCLTASVRRSARAAPPIGPAALRQRLTKSPMPTAGTGRPPSTRPPTTASSAPAKSASIRPCRCRKCPSRPRRNRPSLPSRTWCGWCNCSAKSAPPIKPRPS